MFCASSSINQMCNKFINIDELNNTSPCLIDETNRFSIQLNYNIRLSTQRIWKINWIFLRVNTTQCPDSVEMFSTTRRLTEIFPVSILVQ